MPKLQLVSTTKLVDAIGDASGRQKVVLGEGNVGGWFTGSKDTVNAGTAVNLSSKAIREGCSILIKAKRTNTGYIYPGESKAQAEAHNVELSAGNAITLQLANANEVWIDSSVSTEGIEYFCEI